MSLFLYCSEKGLTWLREGKLPFLEASSLMDPFVSNEALNHQPDGSIAVSDEEFRVELKAQFAALPESLSSLMSFEYFEEQSQSKRASIEAQIRQRSVPQVSTVSAKQQKNLTLLCLSERADNSLLWQYQATNHRGMVIELDQTHEFFTAPQYRDAPQMFQPVKYSAERPLKLKDSHPFISLFHRSEHFSHEQEWRLLRPASVSDKLINVDELSIHLHKIPNTVIKSVTCGANMTAELKKALVNLLSTDLRYRHAELMECRLDPGQYILHRTAID